MLYWKFRKCLLSSSLGVAFQPSCLHAPYHECGGKGIQFKVAHFVCVSNMANLNSYRDRRGKKQYRHVCNKCKMQFSSDTSEKYLNHIVVGHWVPSQVLLEEHLQKLDYQGKKMKIFSRYYFLFILQ